MPAAGPPLAGGAAEGQTSPGRDVKIQHAQAEKDAPPASEVRISDR